MGALQLAGEQLQPVEGLLIVLRRRRLPQPALDGGPVAFGEMVEHVAFLVADTPLHRDGPEDLVDGGPQGLPAVQDDQNPLLEIKPPLDQVGEQMDRDGLVLGGAIPEPERDLDALGAHAQGDDTAAALRLDPVEHQRRQAHIRQRTRHQRREMLAGARDELAADRRLRRRTLRSARSLADGLTGPRNRRVETPASICSNTTLLSGSRSAKYA